MSKNTQIEGVFPTSEVHSGFQGQERKGAPEINVPFEGATKCSLGMGYRFRTVGSHKTQVGACNLNTQEAEGRES